MNRNEELNNLVMFPSSKNFPSQGLSNETSVDFYLDEKRQVEEFSDFLSANFSDLEIDKTSSTFSSLEDYMNRTNSNEALDLAFKDDFSMKKIIEEQLLAIREAKTQIKYYLDEIEMFLPKRR